MDAWDKLRVLEDNFMEGEILYEFAKIMGTDKLGELCDDFAQNYDIDFEGDENE